MTFAFQFMLNNFTVPAGILSKNNSLNADSDDSFYAESDNTIQANAENYLLNQFVNFATHLKDWQ